MTPVGSKPTSTTKKPSRKRKVGKLHGDQSQIHIPVGKHKWKALRELKKARIEAGVYQEVRVVRSNEKERTDLLKKCQKQSEKVNTLQPIYVRQQCAME